MDTKGFREYLEKQNKLTTEGITYKPLKFKDEKYARTPMHCDWGPTLGKTFEEHRFNFNLGMLLVDISDKLDKLLNKK